MPPAVPFVLLLGPYVAQLGPAAPPGPGVDVARRIALTVPLGGHEVTIAPGRVAGLGVVIEIEVRF